MSDDTFPGIEISITTHRGEILRARSDQLHFDTRNLWIEAGFTGDEWASVGGTLHGGVVVLVRAVDIPMLERAPDDPRELVEEHAPGHRGCCCHAGFSGDHPCCVHPAVQDGQAAAETPTAAESGCPVAACPAGSDPLGDDQLMTLIGLVGRVLINRARRALARSGR